MITEEQREKIWKWCGFEKTYFEGNYHGEKIRMPNLTFPNGKAYFMEYPDLTLENLFKWAAPKLIYIELVMQGQEFIATVTKREPFFDEAVSDDPAEALALALLKLIESEEVKG